MKIYLKYFGLSLLAGAAIAVGCLLSTVANTYFGDAGKFVGALFFTVGLLTVCFCGLELYTGKVGFLCSVDNKKSYLLRLLIILIGNLLAIMLCGWLCSLFMKNIPEMNTTVLNVVAAKEIKPYNFQTVTYACLSSLMCGALIYLAVFGYKKFKNKIIKAIAIIIPICLFSYFGFHHCVANTFYIGYMLGVNPSMIPFDFVLTIILAIFFNGIGSILVDLLLREIKRK